MNYHTMYSAQQLKIAGAMLLLAATTAARASDLDTVGVTLLRQVDPTLTGNRVPVAQVEAPLSTNTPSPFEVNPNSVGQPVGLFTYSSSAGTAATFTNSVGIESGHADSVGQIFYSPAGGVAPQISHVENYEANYFYNNIIDALLPPTIPERIVNQSFIFNGLTNSEAAAVDQAYDNYAANNNTLFISGAGNGGPVYPAASCYNGVGVAVYGASSSVGPTSDGRSKPDLTAPGGATSFSTPYVSGSAAILLQAAARGDGGAATNAASDARTLKALLLNGAVKPADWTNGVTTPLDARYGAGILNVFNSWEQLRGGQHSFLESTSNASGGAHPPGTNTNDEPALNGWDFNTIANQRSGLNYEEQVNHYYFDLNPASGGPFTLTTTLVWNRPAATGLSQTSSLNDLNLFLYNASTSNLVACSTSLVDNVEHIFLPALPPGRYDLQVQKNPTGLVSSSETYALAFEFFQLKLAIALTNGEAVLAWPIAPTGFHLESTSSLSAPASWTAVNAAVSVDTSSRLNVVTLPVTNVSEFFRLQRP